MKKLLFASLMALGFITQAQAGILIEPYLGYIFSADTKGWCKKSCVN